MFFGFICFGFLLVDKEDRYGDLVYFSQEVKDGDLIFRCKYNSSEKNRTAKFNEYGIVEKSFGEVYVWDNQNTMKRALFEWAESGRGGRVKVFRLKHLNFDVWKMEKQDGNYNYLMNSDKMEFVIENY